MPLTENSTLCSDGSRHHCTGEMDNQKILFRLGVYVSREWCLQFPAEQAQESEPLPQAHLEINFDIQKEGPWG